MYLDVPYPLLLAVDLAEDLLLSSCVCPSACLSCFLTLFLSLATLTAAAFRRAWSSGVMPCLERKPRSIRKMFSCFLKRFCSTA